MELFYHPLSRYSQKVLLSLYEKQVNFYPRVTDLRDPVTRGHFRALFPLARLPMLKCLNGRLLPDASIIAEYLDHRFDSGTRLLPEDPDRNLEVRLYDRLIDQDLNAPLFQLDKLRQPQAEKQDSLQIKSLEKSLKLALEALDLRLAGQHWLCGDSFTLADCAFIPCLSRCQDLLSLLELEHLARYWQQAQLRGAWVLVQEEVDLAHMNELNGLQTQI
ncbi:glutathione S-transferase family protein [Shewanella sp. AS16]|uniref:glutathione S-transferase family protein n=1 Tax=Shewanella sp. AS16 TaxID=2907625 RepID=UPI001F3774F9|nr:glutathione S-transferase family protein [Shewanella sp. AS16]MCE9686156.1 glutathione S-transferase family protein [Shewanella sp. AS16]